MDYLKMLANNNTPINNAVNLIKQLPITRELASMYSRSSRSELYFLGAATFITLYNISAYIKAKREKLNLPPSVPFSLPIVGHTLYLTFMPNKFMDWCNEKYGEVYNLDVLGKTVTVTNGLSAQEALKAEHSDLSLEHGVIRGKLSYFLFARNFSNLQTPPPWINLLNFFFLDLLLDILFLHYVFDPATLAIGFKVNPAVAKATIPSSKMPFYIPGIQTGLEIACKDLMSQDGPTIINKPSLFFQNFVAYMTVPTLVGDEVATNPEVIDSFAKFTGDITNNIPIYMLVPQFLHRFILPYLQSVNKHRHVMEKHVAPLIRQRREKMRLAEESGVEHGLEDNFLQGLIEYVNIDENGNKSYYGDVELSHAVLIVAFASVHTTSMNLSFSLYWLIARPDLMKRLKEEIDRVVPGNTPISAEALNEMKFLNNFIREVLRQGVDTLAIGKKALRDFTFSNGYQVPKGRTVESNNRQLNFGNNTERSAIEDMNPDMSDNKAPPTPARDFVPFGMGKHLCPGKIVKKNIFVCMCN
jgi:hypothetical protein